MRALIPVVVFILLFIVVHLLLQKENVYDRSIGLLSDTWAKTDSGLQRVREPFLAVTDSNLIHWDAAHYLLIRDHGYNQNLAKGDYIYAFFPAFPILLRTLKIPNKFIPILNFILFVIGLLLLIAAFAPPKDSFQAALISLAFPGTIAFIIPYTEGLFFLTISAAFFGFVKKQYWLLFIGLFIAGTVRPSVTIFLLALLVGAIYTMIKSRSFSKGISRFSFFAIPMIAGTFTVMLYQWGEGSDSLFAFMKAQERWGHVFRMPAVFYDWSHEGFGMNIATLLIVFPFFIFLFIPQVISAFKTPDTSVTKTEFIQISCLAFVAGTCLYILFFQGGSLNGLFRYILCTPMFFVLAFSSFDKIQSNVLPRAILGYLALALTAFVIVFKLPYAGDWEFFDAGFYIVILACFLLIQINLSRNTYWQVLSWITLLFNVIWTSFLFNNFLADSWIFT